MANDKLTRILRRPQDYVEFSGDEDSDWKDNIKIVKNLKELNIVKINLLFSLFGPSRRWHAFLPFNLLLSSLWLNRHLIKSLWIKLFQVSHICNII